MAVGDRRQNGVGFIKLGDEARPSVKVSNRDGGVSPYGAIAKRIAPPTDPTDYGVFSAKWRIALALIRPTNWLGEILRGPRASQMQLAASYP
jgi:hypothetical protein